LWVDGEMKISDSTASISANALGRKEEVGRERKMKILS